MPEPEKVGVDAAFFRYNKGCVHARTNKFRHGHSFLYKISNFLSASTHRAAYDTFSLR